MLCVKINLIINIETVKGCKIILRCLGTADQFHAAVLLQQKLCGFQLTVVIVTHGKTVCTGIVDGNIVTDIDLRQHPVDGEFVVVLAQGTGHIVLVVAGLVFLAQYSDVMVSAVHGGTQASTPMYSL